MAGNVSIPGERQAERPQGGATNSLRHVKPERTQPAAAGPPAGPELSGPRNPLLSAFLWAALGILCDRFGVVSSASYPPLIVGSLLGWFLLYQLRRYRCSGIFLAVLLLASFASWHSIWRRWGPANELRLSATHQAIPIALQFELLEVPRVTWTEDDPLTNRRIMPISRVPIRISRRKEGGDWRAASGRGPLTVQGELFGLLPGDLCQGTILVSHLPRPRNPGEIDQEDWERDRGNSLRFQADHPLGIQRVRPANRWDPRWWMPRFRAASEAKLRELVSPRVADFTVALLLGVQDRIDREAKDAFLATGTMHLLAISGLHVMILAGSLGAALKCLGLSRQTEIVCIVLAVLFFAWLTGLKPPVVRAATLTCVWALAAWCHRPRLSLNALGLAGLIVLILNPTQLFHLGAQLSFLALFTLVVLANSDSTQRTLDPVERLTVAQWGWLRRSWAIMSPGLRGVFVVSGWLWLIASPLVMHAFHVVSLIAIFMNCLLWIPVWCGMVTGLITLSLVWLFPALAIPFAQLHELCLRFMLWVNFHGESWSLGHMWVAGPGIVAVSCFYGVLAVTFFWRPIQRFHRSRVVGLLSATAILFGLWDFERDRWWGRALLECGSSKPLLASVLAVGRGSAVVLELPSGEVLVYDAGSRSGPRYAADVVSRFLWHRGFRHIDGILISHADVEHFNAVPGLLRRFPVTRMCTSAVTWRKISPAIFYLQHGIQEDRIRVTECHAGDLLWDRNGVRVTVLHPQAHRLYGNDNATNLVVLVEYAERRILLSGDLDQGVLQAVVAHPIAAVDVALAPYPSGSDTLRQRFLNWCQPRHLIMSDSIAERLHSRRGDDSQVQVWETSTDGAIQIRIAKDGKLIVSPWLIH